MEIAELLRRHRSEIAELWEREVLRQIPALRSMSRAGLADHFPEFVDGLAAWTEGDGKVVEARFAVLADGHASQRMGFGIPLGDIAREHAILRTAILTVVLAAPGVELDGSGTGAGLVDDLIRLNEGIDHAMLASVQRAERQRDAIRERFISILGHDLRNPLGAIALSARTLMTRDDPTLKAVVERIDRASVRMERLVGQVLDFARGHLGGGIPCEPVAGDLGELCGAAVDEIVAAHPHRTIRLIVDGDLRGRWDPDRVVQAISNLLGNAVQHGGDPIELRVWEAPDRLAVHTAVHNQGPAIPADLQNVLFRPLDRPRHPTGEGLGLGLYIVDQIARSHGGACQVTSSPEDGTTISIRWPRTPPEEDPFYGEATSAR